MSELPANFWKPVRRGPIYCSPGCGAKCTYKAYLKAKRDADYLAKSLGKDWKPEVWENLGWHYQAVRSFVHVVPHKRDRHDGSRFTCYFNAAKQFVERGETPKLAFKRALEAARKHLVMLGLQIKEVEDA